MARPGERLRLKDRIIDNISKSIKGIQELVYYRSTDPAHSSDDGLILSNGDKQCHKLFENIDHALLHGLKNVTHGYWRIVKQLSHRGMVRDIDYLTNVTTDLGKGRAWLYASLNEGLLECYFRMLGDNEKLVKKHYAKDSFLMDGDRLNVMITLVSGLDFVTFKLHYDVPYLDLSASPPRSRTDSDLEEEGYSAVPRGMRSCSLRSSEMMASSPSGSSMQRSDSDSTSAASLDILADQGFMRVSMVSTDSGFPSDSMNGSLVTSRQRSVTPTEARALSATPSDSVGGRERCVTPGSVTPADAISITSCGSAGDVDRIQRLESITTGGGEEEGGSLEVIRLVKKAKVKGKKKKSLKKQDSDSSSLQGRSADTMSVNSDNFREVEKSSRLSNDDNDNKSVTNSEHDMPSCEAVNSETDRLSIPHKLSQYDSGVDISGLVNSFGINKNTQSTEVLKCTSNVHDVNVNSSVSGDGSPHSNQPSISSSLQNSPQTHKSALSEIESRIAEMCNIPSSSSYNSELDNEQKDNNMRKDSLVNQNESNLKNTQESSSEFANNPLNLTETSNEQMDDVDSTAIVDDEEDDFYSRQRSGTDPSAESKFCQNEEVSIKMTERQESSKLEDYMDFIMQVSDSSNVAEAESASGPVGAAEPDLFLDLDNNTKLHIMLEIFTQEDEHFVKMFVTRENHTEGEFQPIFVLVSDHCLYLLRYKKEVCKFLLHSSAKLTDLIFISTGLNEQTINIESRESKRQKQRFWLTPGHQALTFALLDCLTQAVRSANENVSSLVARFSVGSEVPLQKIALRKYISRELDCEACDVSVSDYSLVFWEDSASTDQALTEGIQNEGALLLRVDDPTKGHVWKPVYCRLKNGMLCVYTNKSDPRPLLHIGLGGDQCIGCRVTTTADRTFCLELVLSDSPSWLLSAATEMEISEWKQSFVLAVSLGAQQDDAVSKSVLPCCLVLACGTLFLCHEDLQTRFFRTLGRAKVEDITAVAQDDRDSTYCVLEFESQETGVSNDHYVFYFNSRVDRDRHVEALGLAWKEVFMVEMPVTPLTNVTLLHHAQTHARQLRQTLTLS